MDGMALRLWGSSSSSFTRWARRTGSSSSIRELLRRAKNTILKSYLQEIGSPSAECLDWDSDRTRPFAVEKLYDPHGEG